MIDINSFVRGLAWHDVGKPFYMNSERHGILGYLLLYAAGCPDEALVAMAHHWGSLYQHLSWYRDQANSVRTLPAVIAMANTLDVAAATLYSFMEQNPGGPQGPEARHSWQNPFSRLPQHSPVFNDAFNVPQDSVTDAHLAHLAYLETWPDPEATPALAPETIALLSQIVGPDNIRGNDRQRYGPIPSAAQHELALQALLACTAFYPERTYPPVNDTTLQAHAHLSGVLAFVLYRNLEAAQPDFMAQQIVLRERDILLGGQPLRDARAQTYDLAMHHLDGYLVRLSLSGHEDLFNNAVRLDDLHGTRKLAQLTLDALVETMAGALGAPGLGDYLVLTRTPFDLVYYLPGCMASSQIEETIGRAYDAAVDRVTGDLLGQLERDFRRASQPLDWMSERHTLRRQLHSLAYGIRSIPVKVEPKAEIEKPGERFDDFNARFAETLVRAYAASLDHLDFSRREWRAVQADLELPGGDDGSVHDICQVCETQPIYEAFNEQMRDDDDLRKAAHEFRGEPEPICISCIARRILAHGAVRSEPLEKMLCLNGHIVTAGQKDGPSLPPNLARTATFASDDDHLDMGAAFVRKSHRAGKKLDVFPTVHYAADETGNVALLTLQPTGALFGTYDHARMVEWLKEPPNLDQLGSAYKAQSLRDAFEATFVNYYKQVERAKPHLVEHVTHVQPHLARVLSRIAQIQQFYDTLRQELETHATHPLRVLPIDTAYPTLRLMVPADQIDVALDVLDRAIFEVLFSGAVGRAERAFLAHLVPPLLLGSVVVFKEKYPLYLALEAERVLQQRLREAPAGQYWGRPLPEADARSGDRWVGLRLGLCDLRGTLAERGPWQGQILWQNLAEVIGLEHRVDRMTVLHKAVLEQDEAMAPLAEALTWIRANATGLARQDVELLGDPGRFRPVLFLKRLTREGMLVPGAEPKEGR